MPGQGETAAKCLNLFSADEIVGVLHPYHRVVVSENFDLSACPF
jgi:hypothetical protein